MLAHTEESNILQSNFFAFNFFEKNLKNMKIVILGGVVTKKNDFFGDFFFFFHHKIEFYFYQKSLKKRLNLTEKTKVTKFKIFFSGFQLFFRKKIKKFKIGILGGVLRSKSSFFEKKLFFIEKFNSIFAKNSQARVLFNHFRSFRWSIRNTVQNAKKTFEFPKQPCKNTNKVTNESPFWHK